MSIANFGFVPFVFISILLTVLIPIAAVVLAIYLIVTLQRMSRASQDAANELREIRRLLSDRKE